MKPTRLLRRNYFHSSHPFDITTTAIIEACSYIGLLLHNSNHSFTYTLYKAASTSTEHKVSLKARILEMEFVSAIIGPIVETLLVPIKKHVGYFFYSRKHVSNMNSRIKELDEASNDVEKHVYTNDVSNLEIPTCVPGWLDKVEKIKEDAQKIPSTGPDVLR
ncbi:hypothetical protein L1887_06186 [Cichorium endivia]|nr:hypothetical protein L1887_06186 [Cichorium endivia]